MCHSLGAARWQSAWRRLAGGYDSPEALALLDGIVDIYMPDMEYWDSALAPMPDSSAHPGGPPITCPAHDLRPELAVRLPPDEYADML